MMIYPKYWKFLDGFLGIGENFKYFDETDEHFSRKFVTKENTHKYSIELVVLFHGYESTHTLKENMDKRKTN